MSLTHDQVLAFARAVDSIDEFRCAGLGYIGDNSCRLLRPSNHPSGLRTFGVLEEVDNDSRFVLLREEAAGPAEPPPITPPRPVPGPPRPAPSPGIWHRWGREFLGTGLSCGSAF